MCTTAQHISKHLMGQAWRRFKPNAHTPTEVETNVDNICSVTEEHIVMWSPIDICTCSWPCQGLSRANKKAKGLRDHRSGLLAEAERVLDLVVKHNPNCVIIGENVDFSEERADRSKEDNERLQEDWTVTVEL